MIKIPPVVLGILGILGSPVYKRSENCYCAHCNSQTQQQNEGDPPGNLLSGYTKL